MIKPLRRNILVDCGPLIDQNGSKIIITPDRWKRIDNKTVIIAVSDKCKIFSKEDIGRSVVIENINRDELRHHPNVCVKYGLKPHWHFMIPETEVQFYV